MSTIPACPIIMCSFNRANIKKTNSSKICVYVCKVIGFVD